MSDRNMVILIIWLAAIAVGIGAIVYHLGLIVDELHKLNTFLREINGAK